MVQFLYMTIILCHEIDNLWLLSTLTHRVKSTHTRFSLHLHPSIVNMYVLNAMVVGTNCTLVFGMSTSGTSNICFALQLAWLYYHSIHKVQITEQAQRYVVMAEDGLELSWP